VTVAVGPPACQFCLPFVSLLFWGGFLFFMFVDMLSDLKCL
jgi:hypothetical protein